MKNIEAQLLRKAENCRANSKYYGEKAIWMAKAYEDAAEMIKEAGGKKMTRYYRCIEEIGAPKSNENDLMARCCARIEAGSRWSLEKRIDCIGGENYLKCDDPFMESSWIVIVDEALEKYFEEEGDDV